MRRGDYFALQSLQNTVYEPVIFLKRKNIRLVNYCTIFSISRIL